ncbi:MAG TPA: M14 family carboxypeptidase N/E [Spirochaetota bacterium]|nr:M14 family carboxypeptidase N/E [Spirochaetota bacterium]HPJ44397.1 M14 family carboxypeptidase N/E [Spirochaetota bacterium]
MKRLVFTLFILVQASVFFSCSDGGGENPGTTYDYHTPEEVLAFLDEVRLQYPSITALESVGTGLSVEGRPIRAIVISDNPGTTGGEPAIRLTGGIHGSEMISVELMIRFIEYLTYNYDKDAEVQDLVDNRYIVIIPVLNPDGLAAKRRYNSNGVDLNRNFSFAWESDAYGSHGSSALSEPESQAMVSFSQSNIFHLSATFHSGAVLLNMPFDYDSEKDGVTPAENTLVRSFAKAYTMAGTFLNNPDLYQSLYMEDGVINGGNWYEISGSLQDWSYKETGCLDMTIEVARRNPSTEAGVQQVFDYNRESLLAYIKKAGYGVHGQVKDSGGNPVAGVMVGISGGDIVTKTDSEGYYHRILLPGDYTLTFRHSDYNNLDEDVTVPDSADGLTQNVEIIHK